MYNAINTLMNNLEILRSYHDYGISKMINNAYEIKDNIAKITA